MNNTLIPSLKNAAQSLKNSLTHRLSFLKSQKQWVKGFLWFLLIFALIAWLKDHVCLLYSSTDSLPYRTYLMLKQLSPQKGDYTSFDSPWYGGNVVKKIVGTAGDTIIYDEEGNLWVERQERTLKESRRKGPRLKESRLKLRVGKPKKKAKDGRTLTPIKPGVIPKGMVFVMGDHERSFDSRYEELGLIPEQALQGRLVAIL